MRFLKFPLFILAPFAPLPMPGAPRPSRLGNWDGAHLRRFRICLFLFALIASLPLAVLAGGGKAAEEAGAAIFRDKDCAHCHGAGGVGTAKGPALTNIRKDKSWPPEKITNQILNGGQKMPPFRDSLTDEQIAQLVACLRAKHWPEPPPADSAP